MATDLLTAIYPFDPTGKAATNLIKGEQQILTAPNFRDYHFVVPKLAPFFAEGLQVSIRTATGTVRPLVEGIDYFCTHQFIAASRACAQPIYGSISFLDLTLVGVVLLQYQTIGGNWVQDEAKLAEILANTLNNPRITSWDVVVDMPVSFPPIDHEWDVADAYGMQTVVDAIQRVADTLRYGGDGSIVDHVSDHNNPHQTTAAQVGLGNVRNLVTATDAEAIAGVSNERYMTPVSTRAAIAGQIGNDLTAHKNNTANPHSTTAAQVGAYTIAQVDALVANKLEKNAVAADTLRFGGRTDLDYRDFLLANSTIYNSLRLNGMTFAEVQASIVSTINSQNLGSYTASEVDALLRRKLDTDGTATDSTRFGGRNQTEYRDWVLANTIANALNSAKLENKTLAEITTEILGKVNQVQVDAFSRDEVTALLSQKLGKTEASVDTARFGGRTDAEYRAYVLSGTADDANHFAGMTPSEFTTNILAGTAANATKFDSKTADEWKQYFDGRYSLPIDLTRQIRLPNYRLDGYIGNMWTRLGDFLIPPGDYNTFENTDDMQWMVTGGDFSGMGRSNCVLLRGTYRTNNPNTFFMEAVNLDGFVTPQTFGFTVADTATTPSQKLVTVWMKSICPRNGVVITEVSRSDATIYDYQKSGASVFVEPAGIAYAAVHTVAMVAQMDIYYNNSLDKINVVRDAMYYFPSGVQSGVAEANAVVMFCVAPVRSTFPVNFVGSKARAKIAATAVTNYGIFKGTTNIGTLRFAAGSKEGTFIAAAETDLMVDEDVTIVAPAVPDATLADMTVTLAGKRYIPF
jgi:hypothetical protein